MAQKSKLRSFTFAEVAKHNTEKDCWIVVENEVYDLSKFVAIHPGGKHILRVHAGADATDQFRLFHNPSVMRKYGDKLRIGVIAGSSADASSSNDGNQFEPTPQLGISNAFGDMVPYGDPIWYQRFNSPYYKDTHRQFRAMVRDFVETNVILPFIDGHFKDKIAPPTELLQKMGQAGLIAVMTGMPYPSKYLPPEVKAPVDYDYFHTLIVFDEFARSGTSSLNAALCNGPVVAVPPILKFASPELRNRVVPDLLLGRKYAALAISEPGAGSDVANIATTARREGDYYIVNGNKKWITNGTYADYFVTAVCTGTRGQEGISFLLIERGTPGFSVRKVNVRASDISGTSYLDFDNCRVPVGNLIGKENQGFKLIMYNFNHERFWVSAVACRLARICLEESIKYAMKRKTFGKFLHEHQSIRMKVAAMAREVEMLQCWLEVIAYQLCTMKHSEANEKIGDVMCLVKSQASKCYEKCARETTHIFGGNALQMDGMGWKIEMAVGQVKGVQIPAGAEDVMDDFAARVAFKRAMFAKL